MMNSSTKMRTKERPRCEVCGKEVYNTNSCKTYKSGPPYYEEVYIHWNCINLMSKPPKEDIWDGGSEY